LYYRGAVADGRLTRSQLQPQLGAAQPHEASQPQQGSQQPQQALAALWQARRARIRSSRPGLQHESQQGSQQPQLASQPHEASQPQQLGSAQPHDGSQPQLASQQPQAGSQHEVHALRHLWQALFKRANRPGLQHESQHGSQQAGAQHDGSQQLGSQQGAAQPQLASQPQPRRPKNAWAFEALASATATPKLSADNREGRVIGRAPKHVAGVPQLPRPRPSSVSLAPRKGGMAPRRSVTLASPAGDATDTLSQ